ncbi:MAG: hypothetical protein ABI885_05925 [Gammaproteobacteria bacterium]
MTWTSRIVLSFVLLGEVLAFLGLTAADALRSIPTQGAAYPISFEWLALLFSALGASVQGSRSVYVVFLCLLALPSLGVAGYTYSRLMRTHFLRATRGPWVRVLAGATVALIVAFAFDVIAHWWSLGRCHLCSVDQHFPPARLLHFVSGFLSEFGLISIAIGGLCALASPKESWNEYVERRGLEVGQLR